MSIWSWFTRFRKTQDASSARRAEAEADMTPQERKYASGDIEAIQADESTAEHTGDTVPDDRRLGE
jgi:hypothetical protein